jgi:uncharacterized membrane protein YccC
MLGGVLALLAYWLWPTWERNLIPQEIAAMLNAYRTYFRAIRESYMRPRESFEAQLDQARLAARLTRSNLEASIDRLSSEPGTSPQAMKSLSGMLASSHRMIHAMMTLEAGLSTSPPVPPRAAFQRFADDVELTLYFLAAALRGSPLTRGNLPALREDHYALVHSSVSRAERYALVDVETDRLTNSLNTLAEELLRWLADQSTPASSASDV